MNHRGAMEKSIQETSLALPVSELAGFCSRWQISALELYGSASRGGLRPDSDLDFLVTFRSGADWSLFDHVRMKRELESLTGRQVDLMTRRALERSHNWLLRKEVLRNARVVFSEKKAGGLKGLRSPWSTSFRRVDRSRSSFGGWTDTPSWRT